MFDLPSLEDLYSGELAKGARWIVANVTGAGYWTIRVQSARFRDHDVFILPPTKEGTYPAIAARAVAGETDADVRRVISGFLSALCWANQSGAIIEGWTWGSRPSLMGGYSRPMARTLEFELDYLPEPTDPKARLALAFCREAGGLNTATHAVITYFRLFEIHFQAQSRHIKDWINGKLDSVVDAQAADVCKALRSQHSDVGAYLYDECRSAAAHGKIGIRTIIDPDDPEDERRLSRDLPLVRALAIMLTEEILGVPTTSTVFSLHLYELAGFKRIFGDEAVTNFTAGLGVEEGRTFDLPEINVGLMERRVFPSLCNLKPVSLQQVPEGIQIVYEDVNRLITYKLVLDFKNERLLADGENGVSLRDDGSVKAAEIAADLTDFIKFYNLNGRLRVDDATTSELIARKEAFMPLNVIVNPKAFDEEAAHWRAEAERRAKPWGRAWRSSIDPTKVRFTAFHPNKKQL